MFSRVLAFLTDIIIFLLTYCFLFVSVLILFFDRNQDYDRFINTFYLLMFVCAYLYFVLPLYFKGMTLGKRLFKISVVNNKGLQNIIRFNIKYLLLRLFPLVSLLLVFEVESVILKVVFGIIFIFPIFDYVYLKANEITLTDKLLGIDMKVY